MRVKIIKSKILKTLCILLGIIALAIPVSPNAGESMLSLSYIYSGNPGLYTYNVDKTDGALNVVSPNYFNLNSDGSLRLDPSLDENFIKEMGDRGIKVEPFLSNHWDRELGRRALLNTEMLAGQIAEAVIKYKLDGVNIDIENLTEFDREGYTNFIKELRTVLPEDKRLSIAVAANPGGFEKGWHGSYDYKSLARYCDYLVVMTYDEHYQGSAPGPVAGAAFVENSIKYALKYVPRDKIVLGIPFYGRYWKIGSQMGGYGISAAAASEIIREYRGEVIFDRERQSPKSYVTIKPGQEKYIRGYKLSAGTYEIWYENEQSLKYKLGLVQKYNLKGAGSWSLGQEAEGTWRYYKPVLKGYYFEDIGGSWAHEDILVMQSNGWMKGVSTQLFKPDGLLTRAEAAAVLVRALELKPLGSKVVFKDIQNHWAKEEIVIAQQNGIVLGQGNGMFSPDKPVTREEMAVMLHRVLSRLEFPQDIANPYNDISSDDNPWSYHSILAMSHHGIFNGLPDGGFHPGSRTRRDEMAALMNRISTYIES